METQENILASYKERRLFGTGVNLEIVYQLMELFPDKDKFKLHNAITKSVAFRNLSIDFKTADLMKLIVSVSNLPDDRCIVTSNEQRDFRLISVKPSGSYFDPQNDLDSHLKRSHFFLHRSISKTKMSSEFSFAFDEEFVDAVEIIQSPKLEESFLTQKSKVGTQERLLFYPFFVDNVDRVLKTNLLLDVDGCPSLGGIPFVESPSLTIGLGKGGLLLCRVLPGKVLKRDLDGKTFISQSDCDSVEVSSNKQKILIVTSNSQIMPYCIIRLSSSYTEKTIFEYLKTNFSSARSREALKLDRASGGVDLASELSRNEVNPDTAARLTNERPYPSFVVMMSELDNEKLKVDCPICTFELGDPSMYRDERSHHRPLWIYLIECLHVFHQECFDRMLNGKQFVQCPQCKRVYGEKIGNQPVGGEMKFRSDKRSLAGFENCGTIEIYYNFCRGIQGSEHPNPGSPYLLVGFPRRAYLPDNDKGRKVLKLLKIAFDRRLVFTVGRSTTSGRDNCVTWNDIHHKTNPKPGATYGYPDPNYLDNVLGELAQHGVVDS